MEREASLTQKLGAAIGEKWHSAARSVTEIPFTLRALTAPEGILVSEDEEVIAEGKVVRYSGNISVILTGEGEIVFSKPEDDIYIISR